MIIKIKILKKFYVMFKTFMDDSAACTFHAMIKDSWQPTVSSWQLKRKWIINLSIMFRYKHDPNIIFS